MTVGFPVSYNMASTTNTAPHGVAGAPNEAALLALMERTGYSMVQENGQRKYGGPPPGWEGPAPARGCEAFIGKIPRDCFEDELVPIFEKIGRIYEFRLMMDFSGSNRGYAFVMYTNKGDAQRAVREINNLEIRKGRFLGVCLSVDNCRLFVGGIPKNKQREEILQEMTKITEGVVDVIVYPSATDKTKNRGFAFVEYESHRSAAMARRKLIPGRIQLWGHQIAVDWAEPEQEVDDDIMSKVKILYVRNLMLSTTEDAIRQAFEQAAGVDGCIERVKKIRDYAFVHFQEREQALKAMNMLNNTSLEGSMIEVVLAKPVDKNDYVRYTRNAGRGGVLPQMTYPGLTYELAAYPTPGLYPTPTAAAAAAALATPTSRGVQNRPFMSNRGPIRGRGRGAAGSRGAGNRGGYIPGYMRNQLRKHPAEERLYDLLPGMELTPTNPLTLKPHSAKSPTQLLDEISTKNGWGTPVYQLHSAMAVGGDVQLYLFKVSIPALAGQYPNSSFSPNKLCRTVDEAKEYAAQFVLSQLGFPTEGAEQPTNTVVASMAATPPSLYQGHPIGPAFPVTNGRPLAPTDLTFATSVQMPVATSPSYVMAAGKVPAVTPPIQTTTDIFGYELAQFPHAFQSAAAAAALASAIPAYQAI